MSVLFGEMFNTEPPLCPACCFTGEPRRASALPQLDNTAHGNLRDWELKARRTFFNNEGILCLQYLAYSHCLAQRRTNANHFSSGLLQAMIHQSILIIPILHMYVCGRLVFSGSYTKRG